MLFRVWCADKNEWEKDQVRIDACGNQYHRITCMHDWMQVRPDNHIVEFNTGITLADGTETFYGDIIAIKDDYVIVGAEYLVLTESTVWDMVENRYYLFEHPHSFRQFVSLVGNIHETELTDAMKVWLKE